MSNWTVEQDKTGIFIETDGSEIVANLDFGYRETNYKMLNAL